MVCEFETNNVVSAPQLRKLTTLGLKGLAA
jgi:hypothetical protein